MIFNVHLLILATSQPSLLQTFHTTSTHGRSLIKNAYETLKAKFPTEDVALSPAQEGSLPKTTCNSTDGPIGILGAGMVLYAALILDDLGIQWEILEQRIQLLSRKLIPYHYSATNGMGSMYINQEVHSTVNANPPSQFDPQAMDVPQPYINAGVSNLVNDGPWP